MAPVYEPALVLKKQDYSAAEQLTFAEGGANRTVSYIFDTRDEFWKISNSLAECVALEEEVVRKENGTEVALDGQGMTQMEAILEAERAYRSAFAGRPHEGAGVPWWEVLGPQVVLYCLSKILRMYNVVVRTLDSSPREMIVCTSNPIGEALFKDYLGSAHTLHGTGGSRAKMADYFQRRLRFPLSLSLCAGLWLKGRSLGFYTGIQGVKRVPLLWCQNAVHESTAFAVAEALAAKGEDAVCVVGRNVEGALHPHVAQFRSLKWLREVTSLLPELEKSLSEMARLSIERSEMRLGAGGESAVGKVLRDELLRRFLPRAADAWVLVRTVLDELRPSSVLIQDVADFRTRALAIEARRRKIPVFHHQFGEIATECTDIEWGWECAEIHGVWGEWSREIVTQLGVPKEKLRIVGTPRMVGDSANPPRCRDESLAGRRSVLFPLFPTSSLRFGNGGSTTPSEGREILQLVLEWASSVQETTQLLLKPRPLRDDRWHVALLPNAGPNVQVLLPDMPISAALDQVNVVVTTHSTVGTEAIMRGVPLVLLRLTQHRLRETCHPYAEHGLALEVSNRKELADAMEKIFGDSVVRETMIQRQQCYRRSVVAYQSDRSAAEIARILVELGR